VIEHPEPRSLISRLMAALRADHFTLYCQTIAAISAAGDEPGFREILVRFVEEEEKLLPPGAFFPILEEQGLMPVLDRWVVSQILRWIDANRAARRDWHPPRSSVNLSVATVADPGFANFVRKELEARQEMKDLLFFEVTEDAATSNIGPLQKLMTTLVPAGCRFALSSYRGSTGKPDLLKELPISLVKIDGSLIHSLIRDPRSLAEVKAINERCHGLGMRTVAELVENPETLAKLKDLAVDYAQGYEISRPVPLNTA